ncbi:hypothetical protein Esi_0014_0106 [Ectocarpus siliculosus]|uniref:Uncharacterized protein n=1 Tax=Ectocarpus siliculosus TaxID=2880 RepID=D8LEX0_ECTSI|nr:hypothetical protein Esi_0014_0106 [Ectocarpus siliculosus]|eukprot:CBN79790.1 hypothetical protein Esi_0014_0106 [Ectocarpus siliculosus]
MLTSRFIGDVDPPQDADCRPRRSAFRKPGGNTGGTQRHRQDQSLGRQQGGTRLFNTPRSPEALSTLTILSSRLQTGTTDPGAEELFTVGVTPVITDPVNGEVTLPEQVVSVNGDQVAYVSVPLTSDQLNADNTALCDDQDGTNANNEVVSETDLAFEGLRPSGELGGMLGDTARYVIGDDGKPVTSGMEALHGPVDTYRVSGPFGVDF